MSEFFYRIDCLSLTPGNKTAGFVLVLDTGTMRRLTGIRVSEAQHDGLFKQMQERLAHAGLAPQRQRLQAGFALLHESACPRYFFTDPAFGGSIGGNLEELGWLERHDAVEWLGPTMMMTPHNVDTPADALMLMVMVQTWAEWAYGLLLLAERSAPPSEPRVQLRDNDGHRYLVPESLAPAFSAAIERINAQHTGTAEWYDANDALHTQFGTYMEG